MKLFILTIIIMSLFFGWLATEAMVSVLDQVNASLSVLQVTDDEGAK